MEGTAILRRYLELLDIPEQLEDRLTSERVRYSKRALWEESITS